MKEALEKVGNNALGADFLWIQRYYARKLPDEVGRGGGGVQAGVIFNLAPTEQERAGRREPWEWGWVILINFMKVV